jgi:hypothetical protein
MDEEQMENIGLPITNENVQYTSNPPQSSKEEKDTQGEQDNIEQYVQTHEGNIIGPVDEHVKYHTSILNIKAFSNPRIQKMFSSAQDPQQN